MRLNKGFTIIELLIVIVIIGILVAITAVAYTGITNQANTTKAQSNAASVRKVAEAYHARNSVWPTLANLDNSPDAKVPAGVTVSATSPTSSNGTTTVGYTGGGGTAAPTITYWDFSSSGGGLKTLPL